MSIFHPYVSAMDTAGNIPLHFIPNCASLPLLPLEAFERELKRTKFDSDFELEAAYIASLVIDSCEDMTSCDDISVDNDLSYDSESVGEDFWPQDETEVHDYLGTIVGHSSTKPEIAARVAALLLRPVKVDGMCDSVTDLLLDYPEWDIDMTGGVPTPAHVLIFHDLAKAVTPSGLKKRLLFDEPALVRAIRREHSRLLYLRNKLRHILDYTLSRGKKKLVLDMLAHMEGCPEYSTGGGASPRLQRIILMFHREAGHPPATRGPGRGASTAAAPATHRKRPRAAVSAARLYAAAAAAPVGPPPPLVRVVSLSPTQSPRHDSSSSSSV